MQFVDGKYHHCVIGKTSAGKSSLLNKLLGLKLKTGVAKTTLLV